MAVTRIIANLTASEPLARADFYRRVFSLALAFDMGSISFLSSDLSEEIEVYTASEGGGGMESPVISIGVDDLNATLKAVHTAGAEIVHGPVKEAWRPSRFYFRDPGRKPHQRHQ